MTHLNDNPSAQAQVFSRDFDDEEYALAYVIRLTQEKIAFTFAAHADRWRITVAASDQVSLSNDPECRPSYCVAQEGGSSLEIYLSAHESKEHADDFRASCANASYRTSEVIQVSPSVAALGEHFYGAVEAILQASLDLELADA